MLHTKITGEEAVWSSPPAFPCPFGSADVDIIAAQPWDIQADAEATATVGLYPSLLDPSKERHLQTSVRDDDGYRRCTPHGTRTNQSRSRRCTGEAISRHSVSWSRYAGPA